MKFKYKGRKKYEIFIEAFKFWAIKLGFGNISVTRDNRYKGHLITEFVGKRKVQLKYNVRRLAKWSYPLILLGVFHELGHIKQDLPYNTDKEIIKSEYEAEKFALKLMHEHYPEFIGEVSAHYKYKLTTRRFKRVFPFHWEAFNKINEYK